MKDERFCDSRMWGRIHDVSLLTENELMKSLESNRKAIPISEGSFYSFGEVWNVSSTEGNSSFPSASTLSITGKCIPWPAKIHSSLPESSVQCCFLRLSPISLPYSVCRLERNCHSTQTIIPMNVAGNYLLVTVLPSKTGSHPDLLNLQTFGNLIGQSMQWIVNALFFSILHCLPACLLALPTTDPTEAFFFNSRQL